MLCEVASEVSCDRYVIHMEAVVNAANPVERLHKMNKEQKIEMTVETYIQFRLCVDRSLAEREKKEMKEKITVQIGIKQN